MEPAAEPDHLLTQGYSMSQFDPLLTPAQSPHPVVQPPAAAPPPPPEYG